EVTWTDPARHAIARADLLESTAGGPRRAGCRAIPPPPGPADPDAGLSHPLRRDRPDRPRCGCPRLRGGQVAPPGGARRGRHPGKAAADHPAALHFLRKHKLLDVRSRFDIVAVVWPDERGEPQIEHIPDAFEAVGRGQMF